MNTRPQPSAFQESVGWGEPANPNEPAANSLEFTLFTPTYRRLRLALAFHLARALLVFGLGGIFSQTSFAQCTWNVSISPALPTSISSSYPAGTVIYSGTVTYTTTGCYTATTNPAEFVFTWGNSATPIVGMTGITADNAGSVSSNYNSACAPPYDQTPFQNITANYVWIKWPTVHTSIYCSIWVQLGLTLRATGATITGSFPSSTTPGTQLVTGSLPTNLSNTCGTGWAYARRNATNRGYSINCGAYTGTGNSTPVIVSNTCTVSTPSVAVPLPTVAKTALNGAGTTAGLTAFTLGLSGCSTSAGGFTGTQTWAFSPGPASNVIANSGTATNVYAQILDSSLTPITNGGTTTFSIPAGGGAQSKTFYARYYSNGTAGAGSLNSVATFTMSYN